MRMTKIGYACMLEQFHPTDLLDWAEQAEAAGFEAGFQVSEHFHPWTPQQGQAAFAWSFMGALGQRTALPFGTAVTCPGFRYHPAVIAHAAATLGAMYPGRVWLGLGFTRLANGLTGLSISDYTCGFKLFRGPAGRELFRATETPGWSFDVEILLRAARAGLQVREIPVTWRHVDDTRVRIARDVLRSFAELLSIWRRLGRNRKLRD